MRAGVLWVARKRFARKRGAFNKPDVLTRDGPKIVGSIGIVRGGALHFGVNGGRFGYGAAPMQRQSFFAINRLSGRRTWQPALRRESNRLEGVHQVSGVDAKLRRRDTAISVSGPKKGECNGGKRTRAPPVHQVSLVQENGMGIYSYNWLRHVYAQD